MKHRATIQQMTLTGVLTAIAVIVGAFAHFPLFGGQVYLVGAIVFLMPLILKLRYALIGTLVSVLLTDLITGWIQFTWISLIAYGVGTVIIFLFSIPKMKLLFIPGLIIASLTIAAIYFLLELSVFDKGLASSDFIASLVQFAIILPIVGILYTPVKLISNK